MSDLSFTIIDDDPAVLGMFEAMVGEHFGTDVAFRAYDAPPSLDDLADTRPRVVVLDLLIGEHHDGLSSMRAMRRTERLADVPIRVVTASRDGVERYIDQAPWPKTDILVKPFSLDQLHEALDGLLAGIPSAWAVPANAAQQPAPRRRVPQPQDQP